jgi:hypothetical protein
LIASQSNFAFVLVDLSLKAFQIGASLPRLFNQEIKRPSLWRRSLRKFGKCLWKTSAIDHDGLAAHVANKNRELEL